MINDPLLQKKEEVTKKNFKQTVADLVILLRHATEVECVTMYWVNRARNQFVLEKYDTRASNVLFEDRIEFDRHFLDEYKDITEPIQLEIGKHLPAEALQHYHGEIPCKYLILVPFVNNGETIALTVLESKFQSLTKEEEYCLRAYTNGLSNLLKTYLELADLSESEMHWESYERQLDEILGKKRPWDSIILLLRYIQQGLTSGGASFLVHGVDGWHVIANDIHAVRRLPFGLQLTKNSLGYQALESGTAQFAIHFNGNPKRISPYEPLAQGASYAIPLMIKDRRQGLVVIHDENPLSFKESNKHKWRNLSRILGLKLSMHHEGTDDLFTTSFGLIGEDYWISILANQLNTVKSEQKLHSWAGLLTIKDLSSIRGRLSKEELHRLQQELILRFEPSQYMINGLLGFHSDYMYQLIIEGDDEKSADTWLDKVNFAFRAPIEVGNGKKLIIAPCIGLLPIRSSDTAPQTILQGVKQKLDEVLKPNPYTLVD